MRLVVLQPPYPAEGTEAAASGCQKWMIEALRKVEGDVDLVVLPEYATVPGLGEREQILRYSPGQGERFLSDVAEWAGDRGAWVAVGTVVEDGERLLNRVVLIDRVGETVYAYDKVHLTEAESDGLGVSA